MDWEMYDLDGEEVVIRPLSRATSRSKPRKKSPRRPPPSPAPSTKPMPRSAGGVGRPTRCEYVMDMIQLCHDHEAALQCSNQSSSPNPSSEGPAKALRLRSSRSTPDNRMFSRPGKQQSKRRKSKDQPLSAPKKAANGRSASEPSAPPEEPPETSIFDSTSLQRLPLSTDVSSAESGEGKDVDCECHYPGVSVLPQAEDSAIDVESQLSGQSKSNLQGQEHLETPSSQPTQSIQFANPWKKEGQDSGDGVSLHSDNSTASTVGRSPTRQSIGSELDSPTTVASSPLESLTPLTPTTTDGNNVEPKHIDSRFLPQRISSKGVKKNVPLDRSNPYSQVEERINQQTPSRPSPTVPKSGPTRAGSLLSNTSQLPRSSSSPFVYPGPSNFEVRGKYQHQGSRDETRPSALRSKSFDTLSSTAGPKPGSRIRAATSDADLSGGRTEKEAPQCSPVNAAEPQQKLSRSARIFALRMRDRAVSHNAPNTSLHGQKVDEEELQSSNHAASSTPTQREFPRRPSAQLSQSPRTQGPSSPPDVPLPADPPIPPSRCSSRNQIRRLGSIAGTAGYPGQAPPSDALVEQSVSRRPSLVSASDNAAQSLPPSPLQLRKREYQRCHSPSVAEGSCPPDRAASGSRHRFGEENNDINRGADSNKSSLRRYGQQQNTELPPSSAESGARSASRCTSPTMSRQPSRTLTSPEPQTSRDLEFRIAFLEQQNKLLRDALVVALDSKSGSRPNHQDNGKKPWPGVDDLIYPPTPSTPCTSPIMAEQSQASALDSVF